MIHCVGSAEIRKILERTIEFPPPGLLPAWDGAAAIPERHWLVPDSMDATGERLTVSVHSWLVKTARHVVLVDTGIGNGKTRALSIFNDLDTPYLARLAEAGVTPDAVTHVLVTHVHTDHVGWNTVLVDGKWRSTFSKARYIFPRAGHDHFDGPAGRARDNYDMYADSVLPVIEAGQADMVADGGGEVLDAFVYHPTPGHSVDHMSIAFSQDGEEAFFAGDVMHHPIQVRRPDWNSVFCADPARAKLSRRWALDHASDRQALYLSSHFAGSSAGRVTRDGDGYRWKFA